METVKEILEFFVTFGIVDNLIIYMFFRKFGKCLKNKWYQLLFCMIFTSITKILFPIFLYQISLFIFYIIYNKIINKMKILKSIKITFLMFVYMLLIEAFYVMFFDYVLSMDLSKINNNLLLFLYMIPNKLLNIILLLKGDFLWELYGGEVIPKKK